MKTKILKYNLIPMLVLFLLSMLYNISAFLNSMIMEIKFRPGDYAYKTTGLSGDFLRELYSEEWSVAYMFCVYIILVAITVITLLFYRKKLSKFSFRLLSLSVIPSNFIGIIFVSQNLILLTFGLIAEVAYVISTVFFVIKDFKEFSAELNESVA